MRKFVFLLIVVLFAAYAGWVEQRPVQHYLSDLRSQVALDLGQRSDRGNLLGIQPELFAADYQNPQRLSLKLRAYLMNAKAQGLLNERTVVVFPEHIGTWLAMANEKPEVYRAETLKEALEWMAISNPLRVLRHWLGTRGDDRMTDVLLRMKSVDMAYQYQSLFGGLAKAFNVTIVAGSIILPGPHLRNGKLLPGRGPLQNTGLVFAADGRPSGPLYRKALPEAFERTILHAKHPDIHEWNTPVGRVNITLGHLNEQSMAGAADILLNPSFHAPKDVSPVFPTVEDRPYQKAALGISMQGHLWDLPIGGNNWIVTPNGLYNVADHTGAHLLNVWL